MIFGRKLGVTFLVKMEGRSRGLTSLGIGKFLKRILLGHAHRDLDYSKHGHQIKYGSLFSNFCKNGWMVIKKTCMNAVSGHRP